MLKKLFSLITSLGIAASSLMLANPVRADGPAGQYSSTIACANISSTNTATINIDFYPTGSSTAVTSYPDTIGPNVSKVYYLAAGTPNVTAPFNGSAIVSSDQAVACSNQIDNVASAGVGTAATPVRLDASSAFDSNQVSTKLYAPQITSRLGTNVTGIYYSYIAVQNVETTPINATFSYVNSNGVSGKMGTVTIQPNTNYITYTKAVSGSLPNGMSAILTVSATGRIAGMVTTYNDGSLGNGVVTTPTSQLLSYNMVAGGGSRLIVPQYVRNYYGYNSGISVANIGATTTTVTSTYSINGTTFTGVRVLGPNKVASVFAASQAELAGVDAFATNKRTGSAIVQGDPGSTLIGLVNLRNGGGSDCTSPCVFLGPNFVGAGSSLAAFVDGTQTNALMITRFVKNLGASTTFNSGFNIVNPGELTGTCNIAYAGSAISESAVPIPANGGTIARFATTASQATNGLSNGYENAVIINCTVPVFGVANIRSDNASFLGDSTASVNAYNTAP